MCHLHWMSRNTLKILQRHNITALNPEILLSKVSLAQTPFASQLDVAVNLFCYKGILSLNSTLILGISEDTFSKQCSDILMVTIFTR